MVIVRTTNFASLKRATTILLTLVAWVALSNHCVLGAACANTDPVAKGCPMHLKSSDDAPAKKDSSRGDIPCCKTLRAVTTAKIGVAANTLDFVLETYFLHATLPELSRPARLLPALDTDPPDALSFSESVLQRSILVHAPPALV